MRTLPGTTSDARASALDQLRTIRARATVPPKAIRDREGPAAVLVGLGHASVVGFGLALFNHPLLTEGVETVVVFAGLIAVGVVAAWSLWEIGSVSPAVVAGTALGISLGRDLIAPPSVATLGGQTIVVGTSTLTVYAEAWPILLTVGTVIGLAERLLIADSLPRVWSLPFSQYRALVISGVAGVLHVVTVFALVERPLGEVSAGLLEFIGLGAFITGLVATYAFLHWQYLLAPAFALVLMVVVGLHAAWPTPGDAALGYGYAQPVVIIGVFAVGGIERGWRTLRDRFG